MMSWVYQIKLLLKLRTFFQYIGLVCMREDASAPLPLNLNFAGKPVFKVVQ